MKKAFTLVELIITITIIAILSTIAFINFGNFGSQARDSVRTADLTNIEKSLIFRNIETGEYPTPKLEQYDFVEIDGIEWKKGKFSEEQFQKVKKLSNLPKDPNSGEEYDYFISKEGKFYRLEAKGENVEKIVKTNFLASLNNLGVTKQVENGFRVEDFYKFEFYDKNKGIVRDKTTGLLWEKTGISGFEDIKQYCNNLNKLGLTNWRLPSIQELISLFYINGFVSYNPNYIDITHYFSSTRYIDKNFPEEEFYFIMYADGLISIRSKNSLNPDTSLCVHDPI